MTDIASKTTPSETAPEGLAGRYRRSVSLKVLALVIACVLIAEAVVLIPSIAYHRLAYMHERVEAAFLLSLALEAPEGEMIDNSLAMELFDTAGIKGVSVRRNERQALILAPEFKDGSAPPIAHQVDLTRRVSLNAVSAPWATLFSRGDDLIMVRGEARFAKASAVRMLISQKQLRQDLFAYACNVAGLSLLISSLTAFFVYTRLNRVIVAPVKRLTRNMMAFELDPETPRRVLVPGHRLDEIGVAERSLARLERRIQSLLSERRRLAALGAGISKISHDLRNILASAQLMSDRLAASEDPRVRKLSPRLIAALDRAIALSRDTLAYAKMGPDGVKRRAANLHDLIDDVVENAAHLRVDLINDAPEGLTGDVDPTQLYRAVFNLTKNAVEAIAGPQTEALEEGPILGTVRITALADEADIRILIADDGPGLSDTAAADLFEPFKGTQKPGGSGLGVAIAKEIAVAHSGTLSLVKTDAHGTTFDLTLPGARTFESLVGSG